VSVGTVRIMSQAAAGYHNGQVSAGRRHKDRKSHSRRMLSAYLPASRAKVARAARWPGVEPRRARREIASSGLSGESLNWSLRRYVRASSLRVWLTRRALAMARSVRLAGAVSAGRGCSGAVAKAGWPAVGGQRAIRLYRNGQMEHYTQVATGPRGGVRCGVTAGAAARGSAQDLVLTTLGSKVIMESNIFRLVMT
jgi:hypothetical protein